MSASEWDRQIDGLLRQIRAFCPAAYFLAQQRRRAEQAALVEALGRVALEQQLAIYFFYLEDMTAPEVGVLLGLGVPEVRSRLRRGLEALRRGVAEQLGDDAPLAILGRWEARLGADEPEPE